MTGSIFFSSKSNENIEDENHESHGVHCKMHMNCILLAKGFRKLMRGKLFWQNLSREEFIEVEHIKAFAYYLE